MPAPVPSVPPSAFFNNNFCRSSFLVCCSRTCSCTFCCFLSVVSGCTGGLGEEFCCTLAERGLNVFLVSRDFFKLENLRVRLGFSFMTVHSVKSITLFLRIFNFQYGGFILTNESLLHELIFLANKRVPLCRYRHMLGT